MASVNEDGYTFQTTSVTDLPIEMLTHILENSSLKDALSFGMTNRDAFNAVSRNPNFAKRACTKEFFTKPDKNDSIERICDPDNTEFKSNSEKFCRGGGGGGGGGGGETKPKITFAVASLITGLI